MFDEVTIECPKCGEENAVYQPFNKKYNIMYKITKKMYI